VLKKKMRYETTYARWLHLRVVCCDGLLSAFEHWYYSYIVKAFATRSLTL